MDAYLATGIAAGLLALVHLLAWRLEFLGGSPRSVWLSIGAGISVAYVIIFLLPELSEFQETVNEASEDTVLAWFDHHLYVATLIGLLSFYGLEHSVRSSRNRVAMTSKTEDKPEHRIFWLHTISYGIYNGLIGYLLLFQIEYSTSTLIFFTIAMMVHFTVNDFAFREHHTEDYAKYGQWILAISVIIGWGASVVLSLPETAVAIVLAFVFGGLIINLLKEELPAERSSRFWAFALGAGIYTIILLAI